MKGLLFFLSLCLICLCISSCGKIEEPEFRRLENFKVKKLGIQQADFGLGVTFFNPNNFGVTVKEADVDLYVDSVYLGKFTQDQVVEVSKKADFSIPLSGSVPLTRALKLNLTDLSNRNVLVQANGNIKVGKAGVFISRKINYSGKHKVDIKL